jgi:hypothetical protein
MAKRKPGKTLNQAAVKAKVLTRQEIHSRQRQAASRARG